MSEFGVVVDEDDGGCSSMETAEMNDRGEAMATCDKLAIWRSSSKSNGTAKLQQGLASTMAVRPD